MQIGAGRGEVGVAELALDQRQGDPLVQQLDSVRMAELVRAKRRRTPASDAIWCRCSLAAPADQACPRGRSGDHAEQRADRQGCTLGQPRSERALMPSSASVGLFRRAGYADAPLKVVADCGLGVLR